MKIFFLILLVSSSAFAWEKRGHSIVCQTAAALLSDRSESMKKHSFDFGYYCNIPDLVWKRPATYEVELPQHFMDLEVFDREFAKSKPTTDPFSMSRLEFEKAYPSVPKSAGRAYWRIREFMDILEATSKTMREIDQGGGLVTATGRQDAQAKWLVVAGTMGHYVGDLSMPLHVSENYDGQKENQRGIHAWFEGTAVDELSGTSHPAQLEKEVGDLAVKKWKAFHEKSMKLSVLEVLKNEAAESESLRAELIKIDKRIGRKDIRKAAAAFEPMIRDSLVRGALTLAELWSRELDWKYDGEKFYAFSGEPEWIAPPTPPLKN